MPRRCCMPGCKSNYDSTLRENNAAVTTFAFPKDEGRTKEWLRVIPRKDWTPSKFSAVCSLHFEEKFIIRDQDYKQPDGTIKKLLLRYPQLTADAIPTIFPNLPAYLSKPQPPERKTPNQRRTEAFKRHTKTVEAFFEADMIVDFNDLVTNYSSKLDNCSGWESKVVESGVWFYILNSDSECELKILCSVKISQDLLVKVFLGAIEIPAHDLNWLFTSNLKLGKWSQLENLLIIYKHLSQEPAANSSNHVKFFLEKSALYLQRACDLSGNEDEIHYKKMKIIIDQIKLMCLSKRRYDSDTIVFAFIIYSLSPMAYNFLRNFLTLPHKRYLQQISSSLKVDGGENRTTNYLNNFSQRLSEREKIVSLLIDEIYVNSSLSFKSKNLVGIAENNSDQLAKTVVCFMINSSFGSFREVVRLVPVNGLSGEFLKNVTIETINFVQRCNFKVLAVITDNNRTNQNMYKLLSNTETMSNPSYPTERIFLTYDSVHIFKNISNNWMNRKDDLKTFSYPDFNNFDEKKQACFEHLRTYYKLEKSCIIKKAYKLNSRTLFPNNFERQNVALADNIFHTSTIAALETEEGCKGTADFLTIIRHWWDIVNTKNCIKGKLKRNEFSGPIFSLEDDKIIFLKQFLVWLTEWQKLDSNFTLSRDTSLALQRCTSVLIQIIDYTFKTLSAQYSISYVLFGKFQTDKLEERFGQYRRLSGTSYHVSVRQILESEKKIRVQHIFELINERKMLLREAVDGNVSFSEHAVTNDYRYILETDYINKVNIDDSVQIYISGYAAHSLCKKFCCSLCTGYFISAKGDKIEVNYFDSLQRGGLTIPSDHVLCSFHHMCAIFQFILDNDILTKFLRESCQKELLISLAILSLNSCQFFNDIDEFCQCGTNVINLFEKLLSTFANILLNNFTKVFNDSELNYKNKKRKLQTLQ